MFEILYQDEALVVIHKPAGFHVHPHEDKRHRVGREQTVLYVLRDQINQYVYPVHRLDVATSGVLMFALNSETASKICKEFEEGRVRKTYHAVCRGMIEESARIDVDLSSDSTGDMLEACTDYKRLAMCQYPDLIGKRAIPARYSLAEVSPITGRFHQIRRHFNRVAHPIVGDSQHGDSHHNRYFKEKFGLGGLCLRSSKLEFTHPYKFERIEISVSNDAAWAQIFEMFNGLYRVGATPKSETDFARDESSTKIDLIF